MPVPSLVESPADVWVSNPVLPTGIVVVLASADDETVVDGPESAEVVASPIPVPPTVGPQPSASPISTTAADAARWACPQKGQFASPV